MIGEMMFQTATRVRRLVIPALAVLAVSSMSSALGAQSPSLWPTTKPTATPSPSPTPRPTPPVAAEPSSTPVSQEEPKAPQAPPLASSDGTDPASTPRAHPSVEPAVTEDGSGGAGDQAEAEKEADDTPKGEQETNPGDMAFTDYQPFDLDDIEYEPAKTKWKRFVAGLRGLSRYTLFDGQLKFRLGGRAQVDGTTGDGNEKFENFHLPIDYDVSLRRFELYAIGRIKKFNFNVAFELGPDWGLTDAWIEGAEGGLEVWGKYLGKLRVGFMSEPFSLQRKTSSYNLGFLERSLPVQTFSPGTNVGAMVHDSGRKGRYTWAFGLFSFGQKNDSNASGSVLSLTGRVSHLLSYRNEGRNLFHVGVSLSSRSPTGNDTRYRSRPEARFVDYLVDTGTFSASHLTLVGFEAAGVSGPLWVQGEYIRSEVAAQAVEDPVFKGSYVEVGWFITGENRPYRTNSGVFDRMLPRNKYGGGNPFKKRSGGAWEVVGRLSRVDLDDGLIEGGKMTDVSGALNWYVNATTRIELNYIYSSPKNQGSANIFLIRLQYQPW
jgi:phosphate-selective porin